MKALTTMWQVVVTLFFIVGTFIGLAWTIGMFGAIIVRGFQWVMGG